MSPSTRYARPGALGVVVLLVLCSAPLSAQGPSGSLNGVGQAPPPPATDIASGPMRAGSALRPPRLIQHAPPSYPTVASRARIAGDVRLDALIGTDGRVYEVKVISGNPLLVQAAMDAVRQWRYEPTLLNGRPVEVLLEVVVHFQLN